MWKPGLDDQVVQTLPEIDLGRMMLTTPRYLYQGVVSNIHPSEWRMLLSPLFEQPIEGQCRIEFQWSRRGGRTPRNGRTVEHRIVLMRGWVHVFVPPDQAGYLVSFPMMNRTNYCRVNWVM